MIHFPKTPVWGKLGRKHCCVSSVREEQSFPGIHWCRSPVPPVFRIPAKADSVRHGSRHTGEAIDAFGKNEQIRKVFRALLFAMAGLVLARVIDPETARQVMGIVTGMGWWKLCFFITISFFQNLQEERPMR
jgi:hypothetical protein